MTGIERPRGRDVGDEEKKYVVPDHEDFSYKLLVRFNPRDGIL
jgi:hypothetical protein